MAVYGIGRMFKQVTEMAIRGGARESLRGVTVNRETGCCYASDGKILIASNEIDTVASGAVKTGFYSICQAPDKKDGHCFIWGRDFPNLTPPDFEQVIPRNFSNDDIFEKFNNEMFLKDVFESEKVHIKLQLTALKATSTFINPVHLDLIKKSGLVFDWTFFKAKPIVLLTGSVFPVKVVIMPCRDDGFCETVRKFF